MKTLNEIIAELEKITTNPTDGALESDGYYLAKDSLYYLKEYQQRLLNIILKEKELNFNKNNYIKGIYEKNRKPFR